MSVVVSKSVGHQHPLTRLATLLTWVIEETVSDACADDRA